MLINSHVNNSHVNKHQAFPDSMVEDGKYPRKDERGTFWLWRVESLLADWLVNFLSPLTGFVP